MSHAHETTESPKTAPQRRRKAGTPQNPRKGFTPLRKALAACAVAGFLLTGAGFASNGFNASPVDVVASQTHDSQASNGLQSDHDSGAKGGLTGDTTTALPAVKTEPVNVPVGVQHAVSEQYGTISIPRLGKDWTRYLVEGTENGQFELPGTDDPNAVANYETAVAHYTGTQNLGEVGNVGLGAHRTPNTFWHLDSLELGDAISITESKTGTVYTYAVTQTISKEMDYVTMAEQNYFSGVMNPIPFDDNSWSAPGHPAKNPATKRLLTLTSCGTDIKPNLTSDYRVYVTAELQSVTPAR